MNTAPSHSCVVSLLTSIVMWPVTLYQELIHGVFPIFMFPIVILHNCYLSFLQILLFHYYMNSFTPSS